MISSLKAKNLYKSGYPSLSYGSRTRAWAQPKVTSKFATRHIMAKGQSPDAVSTFLSRGYEREENLYCTLIWVVVRTNEGNHPAV